MSGVLTIRRSVTRGLGSGLGSGFFSRFLGTERKKNQHLKESAGIDIKERLQMLESRQKNIKIHSLADVNPF